MQQHHRDSGQLVVIRLGHIDYSNCIPVHARLLHEETPGVELVRGVPSQLNALLAAGEIDVAPCSSIEYARHASRYRILPAHAIGSTGPVRSIRLETTRPLAELGGRIIAVPTASATSVVLLRALLELQLNVAAQLEWFDQAAPLDPITHGASAALRIGDIALTRQVPSGRTVIDLGQGWTDWTGLPFAFAVWQVRDGISDDDVLHLVHLLAQSRAYFRAHRAELARAHAPGFGLAASALLDYWESLHYELDAPMQRGLLHFFRLAAQLGEAPAVTALDIVRAGAEVG